MLRFDLNNDGALDEQDTALVEAFGSSFQQSVAAALDRGNGNDDAAIDVRELMQGLAGETESESD